MREGYLYSFAAALGLSGLAALSTANAADAPAPTAVLSNYGDLAFAMYGDALIAAKDLQTVVDAFLAAYPGQVNAAKIRLKSQFNSMDYPPVEVLRGKFGIHTQTLTMNVPSTLKEINGEPVEWFLKRVEKPGTHN